MGISLPGPGSVASGGLIRNSRPTGLGDGLACAEVCHDALVDLSRKEAFKASDDLAFGPAIGGASGDVVAGWLVESHADDDGSIEGGVGLWVANYYSARNPLRLSSLVILGVVARMFRCATRSSCWCT